MPYREHPDFGKNPLPKIPSEPAYPDGRAYSLTQTPPGITVTHKTQSTTMVGRPDAMDAVLRNERSDVAGVVKRNKNTPQREGRV